MKEEEIDLIQDEVPNLDDMRFTDVDETVVQGYRRLANAVTDKGYFRLKGLRRDLAEDFDFLELLNSEYYHLLKINSPHVPNPVGLMSDGPVGPCLVVEGFRGDTLPYYLSQLRSVKSRKDIAENVVKAMAEIHSQGFAHGDMRPENIYVRPIDLQPWIGNFALPECEAFHRYMRERPVDTFTPPEYADEIVPTPQADVYALGRLLEYLKLGKEYKRVIAKATSASPSRRYADASEMIKAMGSSGMNRQLKAYAVLGVLVLIVVLVLWLFAMRSPLPANNSAAEHVETPMP